MPPWVQTAVLTGWGLNKLTGGALTGIVGELGKSAIGALGRALGITTPVVNIKAGVVNGIGGGAGGAAAGFGGAAAMTALGAVLIPTILAAIQTQVIQPGLQNAANKNATETSDIIARGNIVELQRAVDGLNNVPNALSPLEGVLYNLNANGVKVHTETMKAELVRALAGLKIDKNTGREDHTKGVSFARTKDAVDARGDRDKQLIAQVSDITVATQTWGGKNHDAALAIGTSVAKGASDSVGAINTAKFANVSAAYGAAQVVAGAVRANPPPIVNVDVSVTPAGIQKTTVIVNRSGPQQGSAGGGANPDRQPRD